MHQYFSSLQSKRVCISEQLTRWFCRKLLNNAFFNATNMLTNSVNCTILNYMYIYSTFILKSSARLERPIENYLEIRYCFGDQNTECAAVRELYYVILILPGSYHVPTVIKLENILKDFAIRFS